MASKSKKPKFAATCQHRDICSLSGMQRSTYEAGARQRLENIEASSGSFYAGVCKSLKNGTTLAGRRVRYSNEAKPGQVE